jgi:hypothetical protein
MHIKLSGCQRVDGPVPAVRCFDRDRRFAAGFANFPHERLRIVVDLHALELVPERVDAADHRPAQMQIDTHPLTFRVTVNHGGLPFTKRVL